MHLAFIPDKTTLEHNFERINEPLILIENRTKANVHDLNSALEIFWGLSEEELLEVLNYIGPQKVMTIFASHEKYAKGFNELLLDRGITDVVALIGTQVELTVNDEGLFEIVPKKEEEVVPPSEDVTP